MIAEINRFSPLTALPGGASAQAISAGPIPAQLMANPVGLPAGLHAAPEGSAPPPAAGAGPMRIEGLHRAETCKVPLSPQGVGGKVVGFTLFQPRPDPSTMEPDGPAGSPVGWLHGLSQRLQDLTDRFAPPQSDAETKRRVFLFVALSMQGLVFGLVFALFYLLIGHPWGALTVVVCTAALAFAPWIIRASGLESAGNLYAAVLVVGFTVLTAIERGIYGHAVAWLAVVPLCACLLVGQQTAKLWCGVCLTVMGAFCVLSLSGVEVPRLYPARWEGIITSAGYLTLTIFMASIGVSFERSRRRSLRRVVDTLEALSRANDQLSDLDKERRAFLGIAAHDLRSPLSTIIGFAQLIEQLSPLEDPLQKDSIQRILSAGGRMQHLLDRLLSVQAIEEGKLRIQMQPCDLVALARQTVEQYRAAAEKKSIVLDFQPAANLPAVQSDPTATMQILDNLISNAIKFSPTSRSVVVRVFSGNGKPNDDRVSVEVQDAGPGLSEEDQKKLYGRFAKLTATPTGGESSSGLGLSIVRKLADSINGQLACRSKLGEGATFSLSLQRAAAPSVALRPTLN